MTQLFSRLRVRALGFAARLLPAPTPFMLTGPGSSVELAGLIADYGARSVLVVTDKVLVKLGVVAPVLDALEEAGLTVTVFSDVEPDPTIAIVMAGIEQLRASGATAVLAIGGGSPIDAAKAMIACHASGRRPQDLDGYFKVRALVLPFFAIPTTAGSGSEVTVATGMDALTHAIESHLSTLLGSIGKTRFQSSFMLTTVQPDPFACS